ncbi:hypothetical protein BV898_13578 [Hypsibius exemplaris]|uniref:Uncharacterized protein n=1 Tax=Hypsibius exemplaris TaxID=2072580 RepID=A0A1W0WAD8_HYPEX|nr:hypothetical protein BV898_13578 [Hypsibius exemplaris]
MWGRLYVPLGGGNPTDLHDNPDCDLSWSPTPGSTGPVDGSTVPTTTVVTETDNGVMQTQLVDPLSL